MRQLTIIILLFLLSYCWTVKKNINDKKEMAFKETEILEQLDLAFNGTQSVEFSSTATGARVW